ncbi:sugar kinase [Actinoallomurus sp. NPDC050550]|uniref:sugar kinase n=1 Tax=Actinoallomurus sp. NPDC050550 TaxID=3154937 RepID=UPI0033C1557F
MTRRRSVGGRRRATGGDEDRGGTRMGDDRRIEVVTIGETMAALRGDGPLRLGGPLTLSMAGAETNVAIGLARLGHRVRWAGVVGADELGELVLRTLRAEGVDVTTVRSDPTAPTGLLLQEHRVAHITRVHYYRSGSAGSALRADDAEAALTGGEPALVLHVTGITPALGPDPRVTVERAVRRAREAGTRVCLDVNYRSRLWAPDLAARVLGELLPYVDILIASDDELPLVAGGETGEERAVGQLLALGIDEVVVKHGGAGARAWSAAGSVRLPARTVPVTGTVGAGDAFTAGYLSGTLDGLPIEDRLDRAVTVGAFAVAAAGDWEGLPTRDELALLAAPDGTTLR